MSRLISYVLADRQRARKRVVIAVRFERDADIDLISVQDRDEQRVSIPCTAKAIFILGGARAPPTRPPANGRSEMLSLMLPRGGGRPSHYEPPDHLVLRRSASSNVRDDRPAYKEAALSYSPGLTRSARRAGRQRTAWPPHRNGSRRC